MALQAGDSMNGTREPPPYPGYHKLWQQSGTSLRRVCVMRSSYKPQYMFSPSVRVSMRLFVCAVQAPNKKA